MSTLAIAMTTCPRKEAYAFRAVASLRAAGFTETLHVFAEPDSPELTQFANLTIHPAETKLGCFQNWRRAATWLYENLAEDWLMVLQDDVIWCHDACTQLGRAIHQPGLQAVGMLSPYTSKAMVPTGAKTGWLNAKFHNRAFWGALAVCMPRASLGSLLALDRFRNHPHHRKVDVVIGNCFRDLGLAIKVHVPSLADHIGKISTLGRHKFLHNQWGRNGFRFSS